MKKGHTDTKAMAAVLSGNKIRRVIIEPADNGYTVDTDHESGDGPYTPAQKSVFNDLDGVKGHLDEKFPAKKKKTKVIDTGNKKTRKVKIVDTGTKKN